MAQVLTHFPPADTYNGQADVKESLFAVSNNKDRDRSSSLLHLIGCVVNRRGSVDASFG